MQNYWQMIGKPTTSDPVGTYTYTITIDPDNTIAETNDKQQCLNWIL